MIGQIVGVIVFIGIVAGIVTLTELNRRKTISCAKCKTRFDFETDVTYDEVESINDGKSNVAKIEFDCICKQCGANKIFTKKFTIASVDKEGNVKRNNVERNIKKYFS